MKQDYWKDRLKTWTALAPVDRISEIIFGLIMVLGFTGTISVSTAEKKQVSDLLWAALGCNAAWGLVDAIMNLLTVFIDRERSINQIRKVQETDTLAAQRDFISDSVSPLIAELMDNSMMDQLGSEIKKLPKPSPKKSMGIKDLIISFQIFMLVFLSTFPVCIPFMVFNDISLAMRISNAIAVVMLFGLGLSLARYAGLKPLKTALTFTGLGIFLVALTISLGG